MVSKAMAIAHAIAHAVAHAGAMGLHASTHAWIAYQGLSWVLDLTMPSVILIYGATGGIGSCLARMLASEGHQLHLVARDASRLGALATELGARWTVADVLEPDAFARVSDEAPRALDGLVYAVGSINLRPLARLTATDLSRDFQLNAAGAALAIQAALPALRASGAGASVVLFSSVAAGRGFPLHGSLGMAKAAVDGLTRSLAAELAPAIRVNAIALSLTETPLAGNLLSNPRTRESISSMHPLGRLGQPEDAAHFATFLLSSRSNWITGQVIGVDGGRSAIASH